MRDLVEDLARVLCVPRTGWGKSAGYFIATALLREWEAGPALIVSPLLALMRAQTAAIERLGINSANREASEEVQRLLARTRVDLLLIKPRAPQQPEVPRTDAAAVRQARRAARGRRGALHLGLRTRLPARYRRFAEMLERLPAGVAVLCTTATANDRVVADVADQLRVGHTGELKTYRGPLGRESLDWRSSICRGAPIGSRGSRPGCRRCRARESSTR
jgi:ATP-dependent DNA helicase RecQ